MLFAWYYVAIFVSVVSIVMTFMCKVQSGVKRLSGKEKKQHTHTAADFLGELTGVGCSLGDMARHL